MSLYFLFAHDRCDRCGALTAVRALSYFTDDTLCMTCLGQEAELKTRLRSAGIDLDMLAGCGTLPRFAGAPAAPQAAQAEPRPVGIAAGLPQHRFPRPTVRRITEADLRAAVRRLRARAALARIAPGTHSTGRDLPPAN